jgi:hypothetical protein
VSDSEDEAPLADEPAADEPVADEEAVAPARHEGALAGADGERDEERS